MTLDVVAQTVEALFPRDLMVELMNENAALREECAEAQEQISTLTQQVAQLNLNQELVVTPSETASTCVSSWEQVEAITIPARSTMNPSGPDHIFQPSINRRHHQGSRSGMGYVLLEAPAGCAWEVGLYRLSWVAFQFHMRALEREYHPQRCAYRRSRSKTDAEDIWRAAQLPFPIKVLDSAPT